MYGFSVMDAEHYFSESPSGDFTPRTIRVRLSGEEYSVETASGIFSPDHIDDGTAVLLYEAPRPPASGNLLDIGCGWGPIALTMALESPDATVWAVDVNERALELVARNAQKISTLNVKPSRPENVPGDVRFDAIWSNPPIRIGKDELHALLRTWIPRLTDAGEAWLVVQRNLGADSLQRWMTQEFDGFTVERAGVGKGYRVFRVARRPLPPAAE